MKTVAYFTALVLATCSTLAMADQSNDAIISTSAMAVATNEATSVIDATTQIQQNTAQFNANYAVPTSNQANQAQAVGVATAVSDMGSTAVVSAHNKVAQEALEAHLLAIPKLPTK